ncbi:MAG TPA: hypothetical protein VF677_15700 [Flavobacterium sp.]|jgi:S-adenosylmethionine:diacylglycerol 3-amino-3-carboxypropyl transferase
MIKIALPAALFVASLSYSQTVYPITKNKTYVEVTETLNIDQKILLDKINEYYPDIFLSDLVKNIYSTNETRERTLLQSVLMISNPQNCSYYNINIYPDNSRIYFAYNRDDDKSTNFGDITVFNNAVHRTLYRVKEGKKVQQFYINGLLKQEVKPK